ncbi:hypothetical protein GIB67_031872 [Kingdonia uniflora]|uniref:Conserved oligomeric Golgi complex subunit 6 n=1 Tax=Kingdonia uniflora TaxID=39325 RepID=A0A7J7LGN9_9MAGN|nr:hypothetical protein GIB67_031872 [Kingdonia uniflora]
MKTTSTGLAPGLSRKLKKVLESRTDSPDLLASLTTLSTFYTDNTQQSRRNLRSTIEKKSLDINHEFLQASDTAKQALDQVEEEVNALAECCDMIAKALNSCSASTGDIINTTERLKQDLEVTTQRQEIVSCFLRDYQLSNEEILALREEELSENFFKALSHVQEIHSNCKILLRTHHQFSSGIGASSRLSYAEITRKKSSTRVDMSTLSLPGKRDDSSAITLLLLALEKGSYRVIPIGKGYFIIKFEFKEDFALFRREVLVLRTSEKRGDHPEITLPSLKNGLDFGQSCPVGHLDLQAKKLRLVPQLDFHTQKGLGIELWEEDILLTIGRVQGIHVQQSKWINRAGLELMDMMAVYQEGSYERLCRWVQAECKRLGDTDNPEVSDLLKTAVRCLKERSALFKYCAEEVANMRHNTLFRRFLTALTRGHKSIEVHAHDPLRFVGDMLGWLHEALASERDFVFALLDPDAAINTGPTARRFSNNIETDSIKPEYDMTFVLDRIFEGVCRPFKGRVEQVLQSQPSLITSYKLSDTLEFYSYTISELLGRDTALCNTLWLLKETAQQTFFGILKTRGDKLLRYPPLVAVDLSPPPAVREGVSLLLEIIEDPNYMMAPEEKPDFGLVISALLDPIVQMCEQAAEAHKSKVATHSSRRSRMSSDSGQFGRDSPSSVDAYLTKSSSITSSQNSEMPSKIFLINCLSAIQQPLLGHDVAAQYTNSLGSMIEKQVKLLIEKEVDTILRRCGFSDKMHHFQNNGLPLAEIDEMSPASLSECLKAFFVVLLGSESSLPEFELMQVPRLRSETCTRLARSLAETYELIYNAIMDPKNCYPDPKSLARHPPDQIRTILAI